MAASPIHKKMPEKRTRKPADETVREILAVAEQQFASNGFEATRLDDIAAQIGIHRAAVLYHFRDKQDLYNRTLRQLWLDLRAEIDNRQQPSSNLQEEIEHGIVGVAKFMQKRPAFARLILRLGSEPPIGQRSDMVALTAPLFNMLDALLVEGEKQGILKPVIRNPALLASTLAGATAFYSSAMPVYSGKPVDEQDAIYHAEIVAILRSLLGMKA